MSQFKPALLQIINKHINVSFVLGGDGNVINVTDERHSCLIKETVIMITGDEAFLFKSGGYMFIPEPWSD
jgi:hypothetical protein